MNGLQSESVSRMAKLPTAGEVTVARAIWEIIHGDPQEEPLTQEMLKAKGIGQKQLALALVNFLKLLDGSGCRCRDVVEARTDAGKFARLLIDRVVESSDYSKLLPPEYLRARPFRSFGSDKFVAPSTNKNFDQQAKLCLETLNAVVIKLNSPKDGFDWLRQIVTNHDKRRKTGQPQGFADAESDRSPNSRRPDGGVKFLFDETPRVLSQTFANGTEHPSQPHVFKLRCGDSDDGYEKFVEIDFGESFDPKELLVLSKQLERKYFELRQPQKRLA